MKLGSPNMILTLKEDELLRRIGEENLLHQYLDVKIPCLIKAPYRKDHKPSLGIQWYRGKIYFKDFARNISGDVVSLIQLITNKKKEEILKEVYQNNLNVCNFANEASIVRTTVNIEIKKRSLNQLDIKYWQRFNIDASFLHQLDIYPISFFWIRGTRFNADTLSYAYQHTIDGDVYYKIYQPLSKRYKWFNNYPKDTISLEKYISDNRIPIVICASVKDALALKSVCDVDVCSLQGEGYKVPKWFSDKYQDRNILICFDNDTQGLKYAEELSKETGYKNIVLPPFEGKDIADYVELYKNDKININNLKNLIWKN